MPVEYAGEEQAICAVGLAKPKPGIFMAAIQHLLVLCTTTEARVAPCQQRARERSILPTYWPLAAGAYPFSTPSAAHIRVSCSEVSRRMCDLSGTGYAWLIAVAPMHLHGSLLVSPCESWTNTHAPRAELTIAIHGHSLRKQSMAHAMCKTLAPVLAGS